MFHSMSFCWKDLIESKWISSWDKMPLFRSLILRSTKRKRAKVQGKNDRKLTIVGRLSNKIRRYSPVVIEEFHVLNNSIILPNLSEYADVYWTKVAATLHSNQTKDLIIIYGYTKRSSFSKLPIYSHFQRRKKPRFHNWQQ